MNNLEKFAARGLKAQAAVDAAIARAATVADRAAISPACSTAGASRGPARAGECATAPPRSPLTPAEEASLDLQAILDSSDVAWLRSVMGSQDNQISLRNAAQRRLRILTAEKRR